MGTRSTTTIWEHDGGDGQGLGTPILSFYRQYDGYPTGHGQELADLLKGIDLCVGIEYPDTRVDTTRKRANGSGCLAAQILVHFKGDKVGGIYVIPHEATGGQAYHYDVIINIDTDGIEIQTDYGWAGTPEDFDGSEHGELEA